MPEGPRPIIPAALIAQLVGLTWVGSVALNNVITVGYWQSANGTAYYLAAVAGDAGDGSVKWALLSTLPSGVPPVLVASADAAAIAAGSRSSGKLVWSATRNVHYFGA